LAAGLHQNRLEELTALPQTVAGFRGEGRDGREGRGGRGGEGWGREG